MGLCGYALKYCWEEQGSLGGFTLWAGGGVELCQCALTHNRIVNGELKRFVQWNKENKIIVFAGFNNICP